MSQPDGDQPRPISGRHRPSRHRPATHTARGRWSLLRKGSVFLVTAIVGSMLIKAFLLQSFFIPSGSMEPTLHGCQGCAGDRVLVNKLVGHIGDVQRGDIVAFRDPGGWLMHGFAAPQTQSGVENALVFLGLAPERGAGDLIKRVIGIGGDTVEGRGGTVYVNGTRLVEPYLFRGDSSSEIDFKVTVPADSLWVMGDHRSESGDSRFQQQGPGKGFVPVEDVVGRAFAISSPLSRIGLLDRPATFDQVSATPQH